jgi:isopenicillin N synthase-like dioxygenase
MDTPITESLPIIDVAPLLSGRPEAVAPALGAACRDIGFFYVTGHGIPEATLDGMLDAARRLFALPLPLKQAVSIERSRNNRGYVGLGAETLDPTKQPDQKEAFNIGLDLAADDPEILAGKPFRGVNLWPALPGFRAAALDYFERVLALGVALHRAFAIDLGLPEDRFAPAFERSLATLRLLHYPARPADPDPARLGAGEHSDYGNVTLLLTDGVPGLEVRRRDGGWIAAPHVPGAFVCNLGDLLMRWSNDVYVSTPHRVRNTGGRDRYSIAFFLDPNPDTLVEVLPTCIGPERPAKYPPIRSGEYLTQRLDATYGFRQKEG